MNLTSGVPWSAWVAVERLSCSKAEQQTRRAVGLGLLQGRLPPANPCNVRVLEDGLGDCASRVDQLPSRPVERAELVNADPGSIALGHPRHNQDAAVGRSFNHCTRRGVFDSFL